MTQNVLVSLVSCICLVGDVVFRLVMMSKTQKLFGACLLPFARKRNFAFFPIAALSLVLIFFVYRSDYSLPITLILSGCAVLAVDITLREFLLRTKSGVYENALVVDGRQILRSKVHSFPTLAYENDEEDASSLPPEMLKIVSDDSGVLIVRFSSAEERNAAVALIKDWPLSL